jgi:hypothetical protein
MEEAIGAVLRRNDLGGLASKIYDPKPEFLFVQGVDRSLEKIWQK